MCSQQSNVTYEAFDRHPDRGRIILFEAAGSLAGYAILVHFWSNEYGGIVLEIDELLVSRNFRGKGIATTFFQWLEKQNDDQVKGWALQVNRTNDAARRLYEKIGFKRSSSDYLYRIL